MAQIIVRNLEDPVRDKLRAMAAAHGRSMEEEVRELLRAAVLHAPLSSSPTAPGLGTRITQLFEDCTLDEALLEELEDEPVRPAEFDS